MAVCEGFGKNLCIPFFLFVSWRKCGIWDECCGENVECGMSVVGKMGTVPTVFCIVPILPFLIPGLASFL